MEKEINACKKEKYNVSLERRKYDGTKVLSIFFYTSAQTSNLTYIMLMSSHSVNKKIFDK